MLDDGFDVLHAEFTAPTVSGEPRIVAQFDFAFGIPDAGPKTYLDSHGTACAGVAAAAGVKAAGAAPRAVIVVCVPDWLRTSDEAQMFYWAANQGADLISCSWGPVDGTGEPYPLPTATLPGYPLLPDQWPSR